MSQIIETYIEKASLLELLKAELSTVSSVPLGVSPNQGYELGARFGERDALNDVINLVEYAKPIMNEWIDKDRLYYFNGYMSKPVLIRSVEKNLERHMRNAANATSDEGYVLGKFLGYQRKLKEKLDELEQYESVTRDKLIRVVNR